MVTLSHTYNMLLPTLGPVDIFSTQTIGPPENVYLKNSPNHLFSNRKRPSLFIVTNIHCIPVQDFGAFKINTQMAVVPTLFCA